MNIIKVYSRKDIEPYIKKRAGETKLGEVVEVVEKLSDLHKSSAKFVLLGIPEDIGVRANYGIAGTSRAWENALSSLLNLQVNHLLQGDNIIVLGEVDCEKQMQQAAEILSGENHFVEELGELVSQIDHKVALIVQQIIAADKFPILIGGGHNNSYGNLTGASNALGRKVNCINFDAHTDFRSLEHRHSGNGFSYAFEDGYLDKYFIFGLHRNYTSASVFRAMDKHSNRIQYNLFEDIVVKEILSFSQALEQAEDFCCQNNFGIELDMDAIAMMGSSAISPSGFRVEEARRFINYFSTLENACYLHICEGAPNRETFPNQIGKTIAYLVSDVISK